MESLNLMEFQHQVSHHHHFQGQAAVLFSYLFPPHSHCCCQQMNSSYHPNPPANLAVSLAVREFPFHLFLIAFF